MLKPITVDELKQALIKKEAEILRLQMTVQRQQELILNSEPLPHHLLVVEEAKRSKSSNLVVRVMDIPDSITMVKAEELLNSICNDGYYLSNIASLSTGGLRAIFKRYSSESLKKSNETKNVSTNG